MQAQDSSESGFPVPQGIDGERMQLIILGFVLDEAPVTDAELVRALVLDLDAADERDDVGNAVDELVLSGLVRREGRQLWPTRPARVAGRIAAING